MDDFAVRFANHLRETRRNLNVTQRQAADMCHVKQPQMAYWESGKGEIKMSSFIKVARGMGQEPGVFLSNVLMLSE
jgi:predicted transcriptional regulator